MNREDLQALADGPYIGWATRAARIARNGRSTPVPRGHAAPIGTGPTGESCGTCARLWRGAGAQAYLKCALMREIWTRGGATDVRARDAACRRWEPQP